MTRSSPCLSVVGTFRVDQLLCWHSVLFPAAPEGPDLIAVIQKGCIQTFRSNKKTPIVPQGFKATRS
jgi:hypothetical protein